MFNILTRLSHSNTATPTFLNIPQEIYPALEPYQISFTSSNDIDISFKSPNRASPIASHIDICLPDICHIQDLLKILCPFPPHLYTIMQYLTINFLYPLILCLLTFPHSLYLFPKHLFVTLEIIPKSPFFLQLELPDLQPLSVPGICHMYPYL